MAAYMKMDAIKAGESLAKGHEGSKGWMEIGSVQFGSGRSISTPTGAATKREASLPRVSEVTITKLQDSCSPLLFQESLIGKAGKVVIDLTETGPTEPVIFCTVTMTDALISGYSMSSGGDRPTESVSLNFTKIEYLYQGYDNKGSPVSALKQTAIFDLTTVQNQ
jgi:type VI secretion system secreted protein Hcp